MPEVTHPVQELAEARQRLGELLGSPELITDRVVQAMAENDRYARYVMASREAPQVLRALLASPPRSAETVPSTPQLLLSAARSLGRWASVGFQRVAGEVYERRIAACRACEHLQDPPDKPAYRLAPTPDDDPRLCGRCGCVATSKARVPTEACPAADLHDPALTRWGEPVPTESE